MELNNTLSIRFEYSLRDHLGNTRLTFTDRDANGIVDITNNPTTSDILQENHYYPFGMAYEGPWLMNDAARDTKYQYNGKEMNDDFGLNWMDYGARWYDAAIGRFPVQDRYTEKYLFLSPYQYAGNDPIKNIDINGDSIWVTAETVKHADGTYTNYQTIRGSVKMLDATGNIKNLNKLASQMEKALNNSLKGNDGKIIIRAEISVKAVISMNNVKASDHLLVIVDDVVPDDLFSPTLGVAEIGGKIGYVEKKADMLETLMHEFGHNLGLLHNWEDGLVDSKGEQNYMSYGESRSSFSPSQVLNIKRTAEDFNHKPNHTIAPATTKNRLWHTSTNLEPYLFNVKKGDRIPLPISTKPN